MSMKVMLPGWGSDSRLDLNSYRARQRSTVFAEMYEYCGENKHVYFDRVSLFEPSYDKTNKMACAASEDSVQPDKRQYMVMLRRQGEFCRHIYSESQHPKVTNAAC